MLDKIYQNLKSEYIKEVDSNAYLFKHRKSGARVLILSNKDNNKVFSIGFKTPPTNDTGLPHILEHSVLCGTRKFPVKEVFIELLKGSLNTFLNAMTFSDKTCYPCASCNEKDFANLMDVYMDAVLFPKIYERKQIFLQEGWHYEMSELDGDITYNGVVYNEMKGSFSSPDSIIYSEKNKQMYQGSCYENESGGKPQAIVDLSYEEFLEFHKKYYHPANSYIYMYGDMDVEEKLKWLDEEYLSQFEEIKVDSFINEPLPFEKPKHVEIEYPVGQDETLEDKSLLLYSTSAGKYSDTKTWMAFSVLECVLFDLPGAPLKQALLDEALGKDVSANYDDGRLEDSFTIIAKGANKKDAKRFEEVIEKTVRKIVSEGLDKEALKAAINKIEFSVREADYGSTPKGLIYFIQAMSTWLHDDNAPYSHLVTDEVFKAIKDEVNSDYFEKLLEKYFINNNHKVIITCNPSKELGQVEEKKVKDKLEAYKRTLSTEEKQKLIDDTKNLKTYQGTPSTKEELATVPMLSRSDLSLEIEGLNNIEKEIEGVKTLHHDLFTNGINYLELVFDVKDLSNEMIPYLAFLSKLLPRISTTNHSYQELGKMIAATCGELYFAPKRYLLKDDYKLYFSSSISFLNDKIDYALDILEDIINNTVFDDEKRIYELLSESKSSFERYASQAGHGVASTRVLSYQSKGYKVMDQINGLGFYEEIKKVLGSFDKEKKEFITKLKQLMSAIFTKENLLISYTGTLDGYEKVAKKLSTLVKKLPSNRTKFTGFKFKKENLNEGLKTAFNVQFVAQGGNFTSKGFEYSGSIRVMETILSSDYLWNNVRVKGGAYGCMVHFNRNGDSHFVSYRDPKLKETIDVFESVPGFLGGFDVDDEEMTKSIIGTIGTLDTPLTPRGKGGRSLNLYLSNISEEDIKKERSQVINCTPQDIRNLQPLVQAVLDSGALCVVGNETRIEENKEIFKNRLSLLD